MASRNYLGIPSSLHHPFTSAQTRGDVGGGTHIYKLNAKCHPQKKKYISATNKPIGRKRERGATTHTEIQ
jgi:hypothetical protein